MDTLFEPLELRGVELKNRLVRSATYEAMATESGAVTDALLAHYRQLARGEVGLIITGHAYVHPLGRAARHQMGLHDDALLPGLRRLTREVHDEGGRIVFQLAHAGRQTAPGLIGHRPLAPSSRGRDPIYFVKPQAMDGDQIRTVINAFGAAAARAEAASADGIQIHAAHGYLVNEFLSPYFNVRDDSWGGTPENRFRFLQEVILEVRSRMSDELPLLVKLNTRDHTPEQGITPELAVDYAERLTELGIDALEVSRGSPIYAPFHMCRGEVPVKGIVRSVPWWQRPLARLIVRRWAGRYDLEGLYNLEPARLIKPQLGSVPLILTGGVRTVNQMAHVLEHEHAELVGMSRPFIREPALARRISLGRTDSASCVSCNRCFAAIANDLPVRCYLTGLPD